MTKITNSQLEQLERDAKKAGAFQAKIAYAAYLIEQQTSELVDQAEPLLSSICNQVNTLIEFIQAWFYLGKYHQKRNNGQDKITSCYERAVQLGIDHQHFPAEFRQACAALTSIYKNTNIVKFNRYQYLANKFPVPKVKAMHTGNAAPEFSYKNLRHAFSLRTIDLNQCTNELEKLLNHIDLNQYANELGKLLNHPELTDTLEIKIRYQLLRVELLKAKESGSQSHIQDALQVYCHAITRNPKFNGMNKFVKAHIVAAEIESRLSEMRNNKLMDINRSEYETTSKNTVVQDIVNNGHNASHRLFNQNRRLQKRQEFITHSIKSLAGKILESSRMRDTGGVGKIPGESDFLFANDRTSYAMRDDLSCNPVLVNTPVTKEEIRQPYCRVLHREKEFQIVAQTLAGKRVLLFCHAAKTIEDIKIDIRKKEGIPEDDQRLIYAGRQLEDYQTASDCNFHDNSTISLVARLRGD